MLLRAALRRAPTPTAAGPRCAASAPRCRSATTTIVAIARRGLASTPKDANDLLPEPAEKWSWRKSFDTAIGYAKSSRAVSPPLPRHFRAPFSLVFASMFARHFP